MTLTKIRRWPPCSTPTCPNVGMGWKPEQLGGKEFLLLSTCGGLRDADGVMIERTLSTAATPTELTI
jgi:hypothetical protein